MKSWMWFLLGAIAAAPVWLVLGQLVARRLWRSARRLGRRAKGQEHFAELGHLVGGLAHEIKNPLSTLNLNLKLLAEDLARYDDEDHRRWLRRLQGLHDEADRLKDILDDFLGFAGKLELTLAVADIRGLIEQLVDFFTAQADAAGVIMRTSLPDEPVRCNVDANLIKQALLNLMINAVQAMSGGGELLVKLAGGRGRAVIEVIDTGPGMPAGQQARIFDAYYSSKKHGTGLGLPTTRRIIIEHHGDIRVESEPGKGTRFIIALPTVKD